MYHIGIDTSCYTTSIAVMNLDGDLVLDDRRLLSVKDGTRGLRQSEGLFQHIVNLEEMAEHLLFIKNEIKSVTASDKPRNEHGSYMPVFRGGSLAGSFLSAGTNGRSHRISHQDGHLYSALWSLRKEIQIDLLEDFIFVHMSGGTSEILRVTSIRNQNRHERFTYELVGGSSDLQAGQFVDRVGVSAGIGFPCGKAMDEALRAAIAEGGIDVSAGKLKTNVNEGYFSFSGPETQGGRLLEKGVQKEAVYFGVFKCIEDSLYKALFNLVKKYGTTKIIISGGVAANSHIRDSIVPRLKKHHIQVYFPESSYASDSAVGDAYYGFLCDRSGI